MFKEYAISKEYRNREEWHELRGLGIGGSDCAIILNQSPFKTSLELWKEKKGITEKQDLSNNKAVVKGTLMEEHLRQLFAIENRENFEVNELKETYFSLKYPFMLANLDGVIKDKNTNEIIGLEIKTARVQSIKKWEEIPIYYYLQVQHYMIVTGIKKFILYAYIIDGFNNKYLKQYEILADEDDQKIIIEEEKKFYESLKINNEPSYIKKITI